MSIPSTNKSQAYLMASWLHLETKTMTPGIWSRIPETVLSLQWEFKYSIFFLSKTDPQTGSKYLWIIGYAKITLFTSIFQSPQDWSILSSVTKLLNLLFHMIENDSVGKVLFQAVTDVNWFIENPILNHDVTSRSSDFNPFI